MLDASSLFAKRMGVIPRPVLSDRNGAQAIRLSPANSMSIYYDADRRLFTLATKRAVFVLQIQEDGRLVHVGSGTCPARPAEADEETLRLLHEEQYVEADKGTDRQQLREEFPAKGDVNYHEHAVGVRFYEPGRALEAGEVFSGEIRDLRPRYRSHRIVDDEAPGMSPQHGRGTLVQQCRQTLVICLQDTLYDFRLDLFYRVTPEQDVLERWVEVRNGTDRAVLVDRLSFACVHAPITHIHLVHVSGSTGREFQKENLPLRQGVHVLEQSGLNTGHGHNPFFFLCDSEKEREECGPVLFGALAFSGNWALHFETLPNGLPRVFGGYGTRDFGLLLQPGQSHRTPAMLVGWADDGIGGASRRLHGFLREHVLPATKSRFRAVLFNSWEATAFDVCEKQQIELARIAASVGVELYCLDDGWFGARSHSRAGLGDWTPRKEAFPGGLKPLADVVHGLGMKFGVWVEPEMVNPDSELYRKHPDWVLHFPGRPRTEARNQLILDFGRPEVVAFLLNQLSAIVTEADVDFFKWDMNRYASEPGSVCGQAIWVEHVRGVYHLMDELRKKHPHLEIQSCSAGGGRVDAGIFARCDQAWISDNTDAHERTSIQEGYSLAYPARTMECWVTDERNRLTNRESSLALRFDVAMRGCLGIGSPLNELCAEELDRYREFVRFYKKIRDVVQEGDLFRIESLSQASASVHLYVSSDRRRAVFSSIILASPHGLLRGPFRLRGLDPCLTYHIRNHNEEEVGSCSGWQLMSLGLPDDHLLVGACRSVRSRTLLLEA